MKDRVIRLAKICFSLILMYVLLSQIEYGEIKRVSEEIRMSAVLVAIIIYIISVAINAVKWHVLLPETKISFLLYLSFRTQFYSTVLPGQLFGEASKLTAWKGQKEDMTKVAVSVVYDKITGIIGQMVVAVVGFSFATIIKNDAWKWSLLELCTVFLVLIYFSTEKHMAQLIKSIIDIFFKKSNMLGKKLSEFYGAWCFFSKDRKILVTSVLWGIVNQIVGNIMIFYLSETLGLGMGFLDYCWIMPMLSLILLIPISFAGVGLRDVSLASMLALYNVSSGRALVISSSLLLGQIVSALIGGVLILISSIRNKDNKKIFFPLSKKE